MNKQINTQHNVQESEVLSEDLLLDAERLFSKGLIELIKDRGHGFIEQGGEGAFMFDSNGNKYVDCLTSSSTYNLGRHNKNIIRELQLASREIDQGLFLTTSEEKVALAESLASFVPGPLNSILMQAARGESFDGACKYARGYTGRSELIAIEGNWHGQTGFAVSLTKRDDREDFGSTIPDTRIIKKDVINCAVSNKTAAVIVEPVQVENHCCTFDIEYMKNLREICDKHGALLVFDETQTGFGRTGTKFTYESLGVTPDILIFGEAITNGVFPMAGMIYTNKIKNFYEQYPAIHISTFGGHDIGCRVACKAIAEYERVKPWNNASVMGDKLIKGLQSIAQETPSIVDSVSGTGLLVSMKLQTKQLANKFCAAAAAEGIIVTKGLLDNASVVFRPTLTINSTEIDLILEGCNKALRSLI